MGLGNPWKIVVPHLLIRWMVGLGYWDGRSHGEYTSVYGYTLDKTYNESWLKAIK